MTHQILFVGGIHGVGKTEFCRKIADQLKIDHITASTLIREARQSIADEQKLVAKVVENQELLIRSLRYYQDIPRPFLLDGHFCLLNKSTSVQPVPLDTFKQINPKAVIVLVDVPEAIMERIQKRDNISYDRNFINNFQSREINHARSICNTLNLPILVHGLTDDFDKALDFIKNTYLNEGRVI